MAGNQLPISNIVNISVSATPTGASMPNTSNCALFSDETPDPVFSDGYKIYREPTEVGEDFGTDSDTYKMALALFSQAPNILANSGYLVIFTMEPSETLDGAITRTKDLVAYCGMAATWIESEQETLDAAAVAQALNKILFVVQRNDAALDVTTGLLWKLQDGSLSHTRGLYYGGATDLSALQMKAAYMGRAMSTIFSGSNTTQTMHLKSLATIASDPSMDQTIFEKSKVAGADTYVSFEGVPAVNCAGANRYFDQVYNLMWFVFALQVSGFNYLRQTGTKVPQTENGMDGLKGAYRSVCEQAVTNQYAAPGTWNSPVTFGNQADLIANVEQFGYYIYSTPIAQQLQADREERKAPLVQIALKEAGAIQSSTVVVNVNA
jgi:hypothetical protein